MPRFAFPADSCTVCASLCQVRRYDENDMQRLR